VKGIVRKDILIDFYKRIEELGFDVEIRGFYNYNEPREFVITNKKRTVVVSEMALSSFRKKEDLSEIIKYIKENLEQVDSTQ